MQVKILNDAEFEALPYPDMSTSVGVADPRTKTAYVRKTHMPIIDAFTIAHELEHLEDGHEGVHADHFRNGVYYKGFPEIATMLGSVIPGPWQPVAMAGGAMQARQAQKKAAGQEQDMFRQMQGGGGGQEGPMGSFQPEVSQPNVIQTGGGSGFGQSGSQGQEGGGGGLIDRIRGFFSGRDPQRSF